jgi:hypothetical protein
MISCKKEGNPSWDVDVQLPLLNSSLSINDLIPDSLLQVGSDNSLTLVYKNPIYTINLDSLVNIPDTITHKFYPGFAGLQIAPGQEFYSQTEQQSFNFKGAEITQLILDQGKVEVNFTNTLHEKVIITYTITSATKGGAAFSISETIPAATTSPYHFTKKYDISGYTLDMTGNTHASSNHLITTSKVKLANDASAVTLLASDNFNMLVTFSDVSIAYGKGYFAMQESNFGPAITDLKIFKIIHSGNLDFEKIKIALTIENRFGVDARINFSEITSINTRTNQEISLNSPVIGQTINISRALETHNASQPVIPSIYNFDLSTSNILDMLENMPDKLRYAGGMKINPLGNISQGNDFVYKGNYFTAFLDMELPLSLIASNLNIGDTIAFNPGNPDDSKDINGGELTLIADNGFPLNAQLFIVSLDQQGFPLDTLIDNRSIAGAALNSDGFAPLARRTLFTIPVSKERMNLLYTASKMVIVALFNTNGTSGQYLQIYNSYKLDLKLTAKFNYVVE